MTNRAKLQCMCGVCGSVTAGAQMNNGPSARLLAGGRNNRPSVRLCWTLYVGLWPSTAWRGGILVLLETEASAKTQKHFREGLVGYSCPVGRPLQIVKGWKGGILVLGCFANGGTPPQPSSPSLLHPPDREGLRGSLRGRCLRGRRHVLPSAKILLLRVYLEVHG